MTSVNNDQPDDPLIAMFKRHANGLAEEAFRAGRRKGKAEGFSLGMSTAALFVNLILYLLQKGWL